MTRRHVPDMTVRLMLLNLRQERTAGVERDLELSEADERSFEEHCIAAQTNAVVVGGSLSINRSWLRKAHGFVRADKWSSFHKKRRSQFSFSKAHTWSATVLADELNTSFLKGGAYLLHGCLSPS